MEEQLRGLSNAVTQFVVTFNCLRTKLGSWLRSTVEENQLADVLEGPNSGVDDPVGVGLLLVDGCVLRAEPSLSGVCSSGLNVHRLFTYWLTAWLSNYELISDYLRLRWGSFYILVMSCPVLLLMDKPAETSILVTFVPWMLRWRWCWSHTFLLTLVFNYMYGLSSAKHGRYNVAFCFIHEKRCLISSLVQTDLVHLFIYLTIFSVPSYIFFVLLKILTLALPFVSYSCYFVKIRDMSKPFGAFKNVFVPVLSL